MRDDTSLHQVDDHWSYAGFYDVAAEHHDDAAPQPVRPHNCCCYRLEISSDENVRQRAQECGKGRVVPRRRRELLCSNLVRPPLDWNGADLRQIGLGNVIA
jgi:hypothetical protein